MTSLLIVTGYMKVGIPLEARCFLMSLSVPYQLKFGVEWPIRGRWTLAVCVCVCMWSVQIKGEHYQEYCHGLG